MKNTRIAYLLTLSFLLPSACISQSMMHLESSEIKNILKEISGVNIPFSTIYYNNFPCTACPEASILFYSNKSSAALIYKGLRQNGSISMGGFSISGNDVITILLNWNNDSKDGIQNAKIELILKTVNPRDYGTNCSLIFFNSNVEMDALISLNYDQISKMRYAVESTKSYLLQKNYNDSIKTVIDLKKRKLEDEKRKKDEEDMRLALQMRRINDSLAAEKKRFSDSMYFERKLTLKVLDTIDGGIVFEVIKPGHAMLFSKIISVERHGKSFDEIIGEARNIMNSRGYRFPTKREGKIFKEFYQDQTFRILFCNITTNESFKFSYENNNTKYLYFILYVGKTESGVFDKSNKMYFFGVKELL